MDTYIVRIYRREATGRHRLVGVVEEVGVKGTKAFVNLRGLWKILATPRNCSRRRPLARSPGRSHL